MPRSGSGSYNLPTNSWNPATLGVSATPADWQALINDVAAALTGSLAADGQTPLSGNLNANGNRIVGLAAGQATGQSLRWEQLFSQGLQGTLASASTVDIGAQNTTVLNITGTTTITSFGTNYNGPRFIRFDGVLTLTNSATLVLPSGANITTAAGDFVVAVPLGNPATGWRVAVYQRASGAALVAATVSPASETVAGIVELATGAEVAAGSDNTRAVTPFSLLSRGATETEAGLVELASTAEAQAGLADNRAISPARMKDAQIRLGTSVSASGTAVDFTGIPSWAKRVTVLISGLSSSGTSPYLIQLGSGSVQTTGYLSFSTRIAASNTGTNYTSGVGMNIASASDTHSGVTVFTLQSGNIWIASGNATNSTQTFQLPHVGSVTLSGALDRVRFTTLGGSDTFDAGTINITWE